jgi:hypothetical protein
MKMKAKRAIQNEGDFFGRTVLVLLICTMAEPVIALNTNLPPGKNFDLRHWSLTLPVDSSGGTNGAPVVISPTQLASGYTNAAFFYTGTDGAMVLQCPALGATTSGSSNPRTELREMLNTNDNSVDWTAKGVSSLTGQCKVNAIAIGGEVAIGQVHGYNVNLPLVILRYDNTQNLGTIDASVKYNTTNTPVNGDTDKTLTFSNVGLNNLITYQIMLSNGVVFITVNGSTQSQNIYATDTNWAGVTFYFKAGDYYFNNGGTGNASGVSFYALTASHTPCFYDVNMSGSKLIFDGGVGNAGSTYYVLAATNLDQPLNNWTHLATNVFDSAGTFHFTNTMGSIKQRFFTIKVN